jgi:hypothetical protein
MASSVEAVIISGPRRGEIVQLADETIAEVSDADITALNEALDGLLVALDRVAAEVRATLETFLPLETSTHMGTEGGQALCPKSWRLLPLGEHL